MLTGGTNGDDLSLIPARRKMSLVSFECSNMFWHQWTCAITYCEGFVENPAVFCARLSPSIKTKMSAEEFHAKCKVTAPVCWPWKDCRTCEVGQADYRWAVAPEAASSTVPGSYPSVVLAHCAVPLKIAGNRCKTDCVNTLTRASYCITWDPVSQKGIVTT